MKVYTKIVYDKDDNIIEQHSYDYDGPVSHAGPKTKIQSKLRASKKNANNDLVDADKIKKMIEKAKEGKTSKSAKINQKNLENYKKELKKVESGAVNNTVDGTGTAAGTGTANYPGENKPSVGPGLQENILHKFASYTTLFTLSGVTEGELQDHSFLDNTVHDVIARSSGIGADINQSGSGRRTSGNPNVDNTQQAVNEFTSFQNAVGVLKKGRDIFFEEVEMLSTVGPSEERGLADFVKMQFKLHEPFGISFIEKVRAAARINGYRDHLDAPLLLTIEFRGFDENGIPMDGGGTVRKIPILITRVELDVNEGGAIYDVTAVRINDIAFDDRFKFPRSKIEIAASTLAQAGQQLAEQLNKQILRERDENKVREVLDEYRIEFDQEVLDLSKGFIGDKDVRNTRVKSGPFPTGGPKKKIIDIEVGEAEISNLVSLTKLLEDMVRSTVGYEDLASDFWTSYLRRTGQIKSREDASEEIIRKFYESENFEQVISNNSFVDWFKIKTSVRTDYAQFDNINKMHRKIVTYRVIPYKVHVLKFMRPGIFMSKGVAKNDVKKQYNYLYTGENTDIQNLRINYKTAYYMRNTIEVGKDADGVFEKVDNIITKLLGKQDTDNGDITATRSAPSIVKGRNTFNKADSNLGKTARSQDFYDYLTNPTVDMMRIEMEILGDPAFICQDQYIPLDGNDQARKSGDIYDSVSGSFNADSHTPLMELIYRLPDDINDKTGVMFEGKSTAPEENLFFAGVYQIVRIESKFTNGQFLQTLTCVRLNNQNGAGEPLFELTQTAAKKFTDANNKKINFTSKKDDGKSDAKTLSNEIGEITGS
jgi:hypothetical protein